MKSDLVLSVLLLKEVVFIPSSLLESIRERLYKHDWR